MARTTKQLAAKINRTNFPHITEKTELELAILIATYQDGTTRPVAVAGTVNEAMQLAADHANRTEPVVEYNLWSNKYGGGYQIAATIK